jgi:hypothetical protein
MDVDVSSKLLLKTPTSNYLAKCFIVYYESRKRELKDKTYKKPKNFLCLYLFFFFLLFYNVLPSLLSLVIICLIVVLDSLHLLNLYIVLDE